MEIRYYLPRLEFKQTTEKMDRSKVIAFLHVSLDGFVAGPNGELEWAIVDEEISAEVHKRIHNIDAALYGRVTYQMMEGYWPTVPANPASTPQEIAHAHWIEQIHKVVFSRTLGQAQWNSTTLIQDNLAQAVAKLKQPPGQTLMIFGSPTLTHAFMRLDLIDEYLLCLNPLILGNGVPLFEGIQGQASLKLLESKTFGSGVVLLRYGVVRG